MAMTKCKECGTSVSTKADACPKCGAKQVHTSGCAKVALGFVLIIVFAIILGQCVSNSNTQPKNISNNQSRAPSVTPTASTAATASTTSTQQQAPKPGDQWSYSSDQDDMSKGVMHVASVDSTNTLNFDPPYSGEQHATLSLRSHPRFGHNVILRIERGQFNCNPVEGCAVLVRFDNNKAQRFPASGPSDDSTTAIFINDYPKFVREMTKAKRVRIAVEFFQQGIQTLDFDVSGFSDVKYKSNN